MVSIYLDMSCPSRVKNLKVGDITIQFIRTLSDDELSDLFVHTHNDTYYYANRYILENYNWLKERIEMDSKGDDQSGAKKPDKGVVSYSSGYISFSIDLNSNEIIEIIFRTIREESLDPNDDWN